MAEGNESGCGCSTIIIIGLLMYIVYLLGGCWFPRYNMTMKCKKYEVEYMGEDRKDMYSFIIKAVDIEDAFNIALLKKDKETDVIVSICEKMWH